MKIIIASIFILLLSSHASQLRIIGGSQVNVDDSNWSAIVSLRYAGKHYCGGSLIAPQWVLTAAHCWHDSNGNPYALDTENDKVALLDHNLTQQTLYDIQELVIYPNYNPDTMDNDLTLLKLSTPITVVEPILLDHSLSLTDGTASYVAGWGDTDIDSTATSFPDELMYVDVPIIDFDTCNNAYQNLGISLTPNMICAGYMQGEKDSCQGDSGGPLLSNDNGKLLQSGIVSWGVGCAEPNQPGVYTKVQNYISWIDSYIVNDNIASIIAITNYLLY